MEFLDEETRPRFLFQSRSPHTSPSQSSHSQPQNSSPLRNRALFISLSLSSSLLFFTLSLLYLQSEPLKSLFLWFSLSLFLGPFAPSSVTAGDIRVGLGPTLPPPSSPELEISDEPNKKANRRSKSRKVEELGTIPMVEVVKEERKNVGNGRKGDLVEMVEEEEEEREWSDLDLDLLRKQMVKHPVGKPGRWEAIAEAFKGRHGVESVIKMAKSMGEKKMSDSDSFARFLKDRKPVDQRIEGASESESSELRRENGEVQKEIGGLNWSPGDDLALLNALKAFPKDVSMRWEKIAASVPGKSRAACMKRVAELKRDFRSSKA